MKRSTQQNHNVNRPWSIDRYGRLLAGLSTLLFTSLGIMHSPWWLCGTIFGAVNLVLTSLTDRCGMHYMLKSMGAREREDIFLPGGEVRADPLVSRPDQHKKELHLSVK